MAFCPNCGRVIPDGMVCDCQAQADNNPPAPNKNNIKKQLVVGITTVAVIVILCLIISSLGGGYKEPINDLVKGINKNDYERIIEAVVPKEYLKELKEEIKDEDENWKDFIDDLNDELEDSKEYLEDEYGKNVKVSVKFLDKKNVKESDFEDLEDMYDDNFDAEIKKAYKVKVEIKIKGKEDEDTEKGWLYVVKVKGDGWKVSTFDDESGLTSFADFF